MPWKINNGNSEFSLGSTNSREIYEEVYYPGFPIHPEP